MAEIPVERKEKSSFPWWLIPLLLLLLLLPLLYYCSRNTAVVDNTNGNTNRTVITNTTNGSTMSGGNSANSMTGTTTTTTNSGNSAVMSNSANGSNMANGGSTTTTTTTTTVTDVNTFGTTQDKATLVGRNSTLAGVRVNRVLSDKVFTVKSGASEMFVMLDDALDSAGGKENQIKIKPGQTVNIGGGFRNVPTGEVKEETKTGGLNKNEYAQMKGQNVYLHATSLADAK